MSATCSGCSAAVPVPTGGTAVCPRCGTPVPVAMIQLWEDRGEPDPADTPTLHTQATPVIGRRVSRWSTRPPWAPRDDEEARTLAQQLIAQSSGERRPIEKAPTGLGWPYWTLMAVFVFCCGVVGAVLAP